MKDEDALPISTPTAPSSSSFSTTTSKKETNNNNNINNSSILGRGRYKFWAFAAIILLAFWSMLTGTVSLRWSAGNLNAISDNIDIPLPEDLDVLEMEEREKSVKHMWDVYTNSRGIKLPKFWQEAFEAAYEELTSDVPGVPEEAINEIAKMSVRYIPIIESLPLHSSLSEMLQRDHFILRTKKSQRASSTRFETLWIMGRPSTVLHLNTVLLSAAGFELAIRELSLRQTKSEQTTATGRKL